MTEWRTVPAEPTEAMVKAACFAGFGRVEGFPEQFLAEYKAALAAAPAPVALTDEERQVRNLLAVIHRDGGHYAAEHGIAKACVDAIQAWYAPSDEVSRLTAERDALRAALTISRTAIEDTGWDQQMAESDQRLRRKAIKDIAAALEATK